MILWEEKEAEPDGFIVVTHTARVRGEGSNRVKTTYPVSSLLRELPYLEKPVLNALPWQRENYERWARARPATDWSPRPGSHRACEPISAADKAWSILQMVQTKDSGARAGTGDRTKSTQVVCPSIDSIIQYYSQLD